MKQNLRLGRVAGIPIGANWSALVIVVLIALMLATGVLPSAQPHQPALAYWAAALPGAALFLACLLAHELAHALVARHFGIRTRSITLWMLGGVSEMRDEAPEAKADLAVAAAGPLTSLALGGAFFAAFWSADALHASRLITAVLLWLAAINVILGVFNLLPGAPLDGGRVLRAILWRRFHDRSRADLAAAQAGTTLGRALIFLGLIEILAVNVGSGLWMALIGWFLMNAARAEATYRLAKNGLGDMRVGEVMTVAPETGAGWQEIGSFLDQVVLLSRQRVFPVLDFDGEPSGVVTIEHLTRVPAQLRTEQRLREVTETVPADNRCSPDDPVTDLLDVRPVAAQLVALVLDGRRLVGMVTTDDLQRAVQHGLLRSARPVGRIRAA